MKIHFRTENIQMLETADYRKNLESLDTRKIVVSNLKFEQNGFWFESTSFVWDLQGFFCLYIQVS